MVASFAARRKGFKARRCGTWRRASSPTSSSARRRLRLLEELLQNLGDFWKVVALGRLFDMLRPGGVLYAEGARVRRRAAGGRGRGRSLARSEPSDEGPGFTADASCRRLHTMTFSWVRSRCSSEPGFQVERARYGAGVFAEYICMKPDAAARIYDPAA